jgi:hypothetical protein
MGFNCTATNQKAGSSNPPGRSIFSIKTAVFEDYTTTRALGFTVGLPFWGRFRRDAVSNAPRRRTQKSTVSCRWLMNLRGVRGCGYSVPSNHASMMRAPSPTLALKTVSVLWCAMTLPTRFNASTTPRMKRSCYEMAHLAY